MLRNYLTFSELIDFVEFNDYHLFESEADVPALAVM